MDKKLALVVVATLALGSSLEAQTVDLGLLEADFNTLLEGVAHDVAPTLRLGALGGDLQSAASIDHFTFGLGLGAQVSDGLGKILSPDSGASWQFTLLPLADLVNENTADFDFYDNLMAYPALNGSFGLRFGAWDVSFQGLWFPQAITDTVLDMVPGFLPQDQQATIQDTIDAVAPKFSFGHAGLTVRRTIVRDGGGFSLVPGISLGAGYHYTFFDLGVRLQSLADLGLDPIDTGGAPLDLSGAFEIGSSAHIFTTELQFSKHVLFFTPFVKLTGAYQNSTFTGLVDLDGGSYGRVKSNPSVTVSDFAFLVTTGLDINLFLIHLDANVVADLSRAYANLDTSDWMSSTADALGVNVGFRVAF